jgi:hypothetical protein
MASKELREFVEFLHQRKLQDPYFYARPKEYHASKLNPSHCLNAKWRAFMRAIEEGRHPDLPLKARLRMQLGEIIHKEIEEFLKNKYQIEVVQKIPVLDFVIVCRADLLGKNDIIDIKTWDRKDQPLPQKPEIDHLYQVNTYCYAFQRRVAKIWYINYNTGEDIWFEHKADPKMYRDVIAYTTLLDWFVTHNQEPPHKPNCRCRKEGKYGKEDDERHHSG